MLGRRWRSAFGLTATVAAFAFGSDDAGATTICVPGFSASCPNSGGNVAVADLEQAMSTEGGDGTPDEIVVGPGTFTENSSFEPVGGSSETFEVQGSDPLSVVGAGRGATTLTSAGTGNVYLANFFFPINSRHITMRDLKLQAPASFQDNAGAAVLIEGDTLENVDVTSLNPGTDGVAATGPGNVFRNGEVRGEGGSGSIKFGIQTAPGSPTELTAEDDRVLKASWGLLAEAKGSTLTARRVSALGIGAVGAGADAGVVKIENSIFTMDDGIGLFVSPAGDPARIDADQVTIVDSEGSPTFPAMEAKKFGSTAGNGGIEVSNSIVRGFATGYRIETPFGPGVGTLSIAARYSNLKTTGSNLNGSVGFSEGNIDADPLLTPEFALAAPSPSIDAGDPAPGGLTSDFVGAPRPVDGNNDGVARRDQGAYERPALAGRGDFPRQEAGVDSPPQTKIKGGPGKRLAEGVAKFKFVSSEPGSTFECRLDGRKRRRCTSPKRYGGLKAGRHMFSVWATDPAGNQDPTPARRAFRVPHP